MYTYIYTHNYIITIILKLICPEFYFKCRMRVGYGHKDWDGHEKYMTLEA